MDKPAKALAATLLLTVASVALAWQGQLVWSQGLLKSGRSPDAPAGDSAPNDIQNGYLRSGDVPGQALYGWSYPFAFPNDPVAAVRISNGGKAW